MDILLFSNNQEVTAILDKILKDYLVDKSLLTEPLSDDITIVFKNLLIYSKKHLDLIIIDDSGSPNESWSSKVELSRQLIEFISLNQNETYSNSNYYIKYFPIIRICDEDTDVSFIEKNHKYFSFCVLHEVNLNLYRLVGEAIAFTRNLVYEDLSTLKLMSDDPIQLIKTNFALYHYGDQLKILTRDFVEKQKQQYFYWFEYPLNEIDIKINQFDDLLNKASLNKQRQESKIHQFLIQNQYFIRRDNYSSLYHERAFQLANSRNSIRPDFILKPYDKNPFNVTEVLEIKLPTEKIVRKKIFHQIPYSDFWEHLAQIKDYQAYFASTFVRDEIMKKLGYLPDSYTFTLLISRLEHKEANKEIINKLAMQFSFEDINILTYDELLEYQKRYFSREKFINSLKTYGC